MSSLVLVIIILAMVCCLFSAFLLMYKEDVVEIWKIRRHHRKNHSLLID